MRKMLKGFSGFAASALLLFLLAASARATLPAHEKFVFDLKWLGLTAGTSVMEIQETGDGVTLSSVARSANWISVFYPVEDRVESHLQGEEPWYPLRYRLKAREGKHRKDKEVVFLRSEGKALYIDHLKGEKREYEMPEAIYDPLSALYAVRQAEEELTPGTSLFITVFDSKKVYDLEVRVLKRETVTVPAGTFKTVLLKPVMKSEGIFVSKGDILIWVTDDERRVPVKMKTEAPVGSIVAELMGGVF
ncbi:MAG: DUF3108 domain-containing protein [Nitrospirota bacterium]|jgi:hypothetical protein